VYSSCIKERKKAPAKAVGSNDCQVEFAKSGVFREEKDSGKINFIFILYCAYLFVPLHGIKNHNQKE
jgi:hypothetical protein